jgi:hypothetical protein
MLSTFGCFAYTTGLISLGKARLDSLSRAVLAHFEGKKKLWKSKTKGGSKA